MNVAYTNHIGHSARDKYSGKNTAISTISDLAATEKHNNHDYTPEAVARMQSDIDLELRDLNSQYIMRDGKLVKVDGHLDLEANVRKIYEEQFAGAVTKYNKQQIEAGHPERQIESYIEKISNSKQQEIAVEGLIQFGCLEDWEDMTLEDRERVAPLLLQCLQDTLNELKTETSEFILAGASMHMNEGTPHIHYVGVPVEETPNAKHGMEKRVRKSAVFNKDSLGAGLQDNVRAKIEPKLKEAFGWEFEEKRTGRNEDLEKRILINEKLKKQIHERETTLTSIDHEITAKTINVEMQARAHVQEVVGIVADNQDGAYSDALFFLQECSDDDFYNISDKGHELKKKRLEEEFVVPESQELAQLIKDIETRKRTGKQLTWSECQERWNAYGEISEPFWRFRADRAQEIDLEYKRALQGSKDALRSFYDARYTLHRSDSFLVSIIATVEAVRSLQKRKKYEKQLEELRGKKLELARNTTDFARYSRAYRDELKAGKDPCANYLDAMADIVKGLDVEHREFKSQTKLQGKEHAPVPDRE